MQTSSNTPTNGIYGFCKTFLKLIKEYQPDHIFFAYDCGGSIRREVYPYYKANRDEPTEDIKAQKKILLEMFEALNIKTLSLHGYEADDFIAACSQQYSQQEAFCFIASGDKDLHMLVNEKVNIIDPTGKLYKKSDINIKYETNTTVNKLLLYYALAGDSIDNVTGVKGIGKKTALEIIKHYNSLDHLYENISQDTHLKPRTKKLLLEYKDDAYASLYLVSPQKVPFTKEETEKCSFSVNDAFMQRLYGFFYKYEFFSLIPKKFTSSLKSKTGETSLPLAEDTIETTIVTEKTIQQIFKKISTHSTIALDTETDGGEKRSAKIVGISLSVEKGKAYYIPVSHRNKSIQIDTVATYIKSIFTKNYTIVMHNGLFDLAILKNYDITLEGHVFDTMIAASLVKATNDRLGLKDLSARWLSQKMTSFSEVMTSNTYKTFSDVPVEKAALYAGADAHQTLMLYYLVKEKMKTNKTDSLFYSIEMPLLKVLLEIEYTGMKLNLSLLREQGKIIDELLHDIECKIYDLLGTEQKINFKSSIQVGELLFNKLGLETKAMTSTGQKSTDQFVLENLSSKHPVAALINSYRTLTSIKSRCVEGLEKAISSDMRIYTSFNQAHAVTGRLSTSRPNMQNIPTDQSNSKFSIRKCFEAQKDYTLVSLDYSQIELRVLAALSQDQALLNAFTSNKDIHTSTASQIFGEKEHAITPEQRQFAKQINFGIVYGQGAYKLSQLLKVPHTQATEYLEQYKKAYSGVFNWISNLIETVKKSKGYVRTHFGRTRYIPGIFETQKLAYSEAKRLTVNTVIQGTAAEIMKIGMIKLSDAIKHRNYDASIIMQIHDELICEVKSDIIETFIQDGKSILEEEIINNVSFPVDVSYGNNWAEL